MTLRTIHIGTSGAYDSAAKILRNGGLVAFPTETVYGLGADATDEQAVARIFAVKQRPRFNPLITHVPDTDSAARLGIFDAAAHRVADAFWPGPLTIVLRRSVDCPLAWLVSAGLDTVALRVPAHPAARELLIRAGCPVAAPSANRSGRISPTRAAHVEAELGESDVLILDGGACQTGIESTVIDLSAPDPVLLRPGGIAREALEPVVGRLGSRTVAGPVRAPGMLVSHYAPERPVRLGAQAPKPGEAFLAFGTAAVGKPSNSLSRTGDLEEAAANLFHMLRDLDRPEVTAIAVAPIPDHGLGAAINDRLRRAAADRNAVLSATALAL